MSTRTLSSSAPRESLNAGPGYTPEQYRLLALQTAVLPRLAQRHDPGERERLKAYLRLASTCKMLHGESEQTRQTIVRAGRLAYRIRRYGASELFPYKKWPGNVYPVLLRFCSDFVAKRGISCKFSPEAGWQTISPSHAAPMEALLEAAAKEPVLIPVPGLLRPGPNGNWRPSYIVQTPLLLVAPVRDLTIEIQQLQANNQFLAQQIQNNFQLEASYAALIPTTYAAPAQPSYTVPFGASLTMPNAPWSTVPVMPPSTMPFVPPLTMPNAPSYTMPVMPPSMPFVPPLTMPNAPSYTMPVMPPSMPFVPPLTMPNAPSYMMPVMPALPMPVTPTFTIPVSPTSPTPAPPSVTDGTSTSFNNELTPFKSRADESLFAHLLFQQLTPLEGGPVADLLLNAIFASDECGSGLVAELFEYFEGLGGNAYPDKIDSSYALLGYLHAREESMRTSERSVELERLPAFVRFASLVMDELPRVCGNSAALLMESALNFIVKAWGQFGYFEEQKVMLELANAVIGNLHKLSSGGLQFRMLICLADSIPPWTLYNLEHGLGEWLDHSSDLIADSKRVKALRENLADALTYFQVVDVTYKLFLLLEKQPELRAQLVQSLQARLKLTDFGVLRYHDMYWEGPKETDKSKWRQYQADQSRLESQRPGARGRQMREYIRSSRFSRATSSLSENLPKRQPRPEADPPEHFPSTPASNNPSRSQARSALEVMTNNCTFV